MSACGVEGCTRGGKLTRGLCLMHYTRLQRSGDVGEPEARIESRAGKGCDVKGCERAYFCQGLCQKHYARLVRYGDPTHYPVNASSHNPDPWATEARFMAQVAESTNGCWEWQGHRDRKGYAQFRHNGRKVPAHRWLWEHMRAEIPAGLQLDHLCNNPPCVNPWHLDPVTNAENMRRRFERNRAAS